MKGLAYGLKEALDMMLTHIKQLPPETVALVDSIGRTAAVDLYALVDSPSVDSSRKDGFAVISSELIDATPEKPVRLRLLGTVAAGSDRELRIQAGAAIRVLTGARIPAGADAVVAEEYVKTSGDDLLIDASIKSGKNVLQRGGDASIEKCIVRSGQQISPILAGLLAAAGHSSIPVYGHPVVGILGTGDELVEPGLPLTDSQLYASNVITLAGWCRKFTMNSRMEIVRDDAKLISAALKNMSNETDAVITSGGAWTGDYDMVSRVLHDLGWKEVFHRIRIGPGKAVGFGILDHKPVFILPGGPPSNLMGFLQIALPGLLALAGHAHSGLPVTNARLALDIDEGKADWTDFFFGTLEYNDDLPIFSPMKKRSRLSLIARADAIAVVPEGMESLSAGAVIPVQLLK